jgi:LysM repeat protein
LRRTSALTNPTAPVAVIGSIALSLSATPAAAAAPLPAERSPLHAARDLASAVAAPAKKSPTTHTVVRGDTISAIAAAHGLRTADVLAWNGLGWKSIIHPGDVIRLSASGEKRTTAKSTPKSASSATSSGATRSAYTVEKGDTLWAIARSRGVTLAALLRANDLTGGSIIYPGQKLTLPGDEKKAKSAAKSTAKAAPAAEHSESSAVAPPTTLDAEQVAGAKTIIAVGRRLGVPDRGIAIALATAMVESWIRNLDYGTHDSLGLFQQRPSMGWGTAAQIRDPRHAAAAFFGGVHDPNGTATRGLLDIPGWQKLEFGEAAQAVQRSAYPERYGPWESQAYAWLADLG